MFLRTKIIWRSRPITWKPLVISLQARSACGTFLFTYPRQAYGHQPWSGIKHGKKINVLDILLT